MVGERKAVPVVMCWHMPGRLTRRGAVKCRNCGVLIEYCPCVGETYRSVNHDCRYCFGSMWVGVAPGWKSILRAFL